LKLLFIDIKNEEITNFYLINYNNWQKDFFFFSQKKINELVRCTKNAESLTAYLFLVDTMIQFSETPSHSLTVVFDQERKESHV
jgi:hypothetical protein